MAADAASRSHEDNVCSPHRRPTVRTIGRRSGTADLGFTDIIRGYPCAGDPEHSPSWVARYRSNAPDSLPTRRTSWHDDLVRASYAPPSSQKGSRVARTRRRGMLAIAMLLMLQFASGYLRVRASITISPDDLVSGRRSSPRPSREKQPKDTGPALVAMCRSARKVAVSNTLDVSAGWRGSDGYVGSQQCFPI